jgi:hypothetical protein
MGLRAMKACQERRLQAKPASVCDFLFVELLTDVEDSLLFVVMICTRTRTRSPSSS